MDIEPARNSLFSYLASTHREYLVSVGERRRFAEGVVLLRQGDPGDHVFVVLSGWVRIYSTNANGDDVVIALRGPGDILGELAALHGWSRTVSVEAIEPVVVMQLRRDRFLECLYRQPDIGIAMIKQVSARLREAEMALQDFATQDVSRRVGSHLLRMVVQHGIPEPDGIALSIPLSQQDIANRVGASLRAVARAMALLRERGIVVTNRRRIVVCRPDVLRSFAE
jgi:CRP-like cAMP-binding protein